MALLAALSAASFFVAASAAAIKPRAPEAWSEYTKNGVFYPQQSATSWRTLYARTSQLPDNSLLLAWEDYDANVERAYIPIYKSTDGGASFNPLTRVEDQVNGWGLWYQPAFYTLPQDFGGFAKGTILLGAVSTPRDLSEAYIELYASEDSGQTWSFVSHIVYAPGPETVTNGDKAVWEPFFLMYEGQLIVYYSTQTDPDHNQKLVYTSTTDLKTWSDEVDVVAQPNSNDRPGMAGVAYSSHSNKWVLVFEYYGSAFIGGCPVHHKVADSPLSFGEQEPLPITPNDANLNPNGSPYVIWTDATGNRSGLFIMNGNSREEVFVNTDAVNPNGWKPVNIDHYSSYSRQLSIISTPSDSATEGKPRILVANGGNMGCSGSCYNYIADALVDIPSYPG